MSSPVRFVSPAPIAVTTIGLLLSTGPLPLPPAPVLAQTTSPHLVVSEIVTGGSSASDELIELYNPASVPLPLEGLEVIYVSASGATITRRAAWEAGAPVVEPGRHVLVANEAGIYAAAADALYASGMAAIGGSVALRLQGATAPVDAVAWGTATSVWREGAPAPPPSAGASIERLPGGSLGSTQDTDDNAADFVERPVPEPQSLASPPTPDGSSPRPTASPVPTGSPTTAPTTAPTATPSPSPAPTGAPPSAMPIPVAAARTAPDGSLVTVEATALTASDFHDGGGFIADASGGIALLVDEGGFARGAFLRVTGTLDDRFSQRTIRSGADGIVVLGPGAEAPVTPVATGSVNESVEGGLVRIAGLPVGGVTTLASGVALNLDDGSGTARVVVQGSTGIEVAAWSPGATVEIVGVAGQRDSSGSGTAGYRVMPRDPHDVVSVAGGAGTPGPSRSTSPSPGPTAAPGPTFPPGEPDVVAEVVSISEARAAPKNARLATRGVVTMAPGTVDPVTAVIQDATAAIVLRMGEEVGPLEVGQRIEVAGVRSTKSGMETLRVSEPPRQLGPAPQPPPLVLRTGDAGEPHEALLVTVHGTLPAGARRASSGTVTFEVDDGSGPLRVTLKAALHPVHDALVAGTSVEVRGILGQESTGAQPLRGYRVWPRSPVEVHVTVPPAATAAGMASASGSDTTTGPSAVGGAIAPGPAPLGEVGGPHPGDLRVGATLVSGTWNELGIGGLLWDGSRLVAVAAASSAAVDGVLGERSLPVALELGRMRAVGTEPTIGAPLVALGTEPSDILPADRGPSRPRSTLPASGDGPAWVSLVGRLVADGRSLLLAGGGSVPVDERCDDRPPPPAGAVAVTGVATAEPARLLVPCGGIRSAPLLARARKALETGASVPAPTPAAVATTVGGDSGPARSLAAALILVGALAMAAAAGIRARTRCGDPPASDFEEPAAAEGSPAEPDAPQLALVRVPPERGP